MRQIVNRHQRPPRKSQVDAGAVGRILRHRTRRDAEVGGGGGELGVEDALPCFQQQQQLLGGIDWQRCFRKISAIPRHDAIDAGLPRSFM